MLNHVLNICEKDGTFDNIYLWVSDCRIVFLYSALSTAPHSFWLDKLDLSLLELINIIDSIFHCYFLSSSLFSQ